MKSLFFLMVSAASVFCYSQNNSLVLLSNIKSDTVQLRWATSSADLFIAGLKNGYAIQRVKGETADFENSPLLTTFIVESLDQRYPDAQTIQDSTTKEMVKFLKEFCSSKNLSEEAKKTTFSMLLLGASTNKNLARILGVYFEDYPEDSAPYHYRVKIQNTDLYSSSLTVKRPTTVIEQIKFPLEFEVKARPKQVYLKWEALSQQVLYSAYWIERSEDSIHFKPLNQLPYYFLRSQYEATKTHCDFVDTAVEAGKTYYYKVGAVNHFADITGSSTVIKVYVPNAVNGEVRIDSTHAQSFDRILTGRFVPYDQNTAVKELVLFRSDSLQSGYTPLSKIPYSDRFRFTTVSPIESGDRYYYKVAAVGSDNDTVFSFPYYFFTLDQIPPTTPTGLKGLVDSMGVALLEWNLNTEDDIRGYRVYRSNSLSEEFVEVTHFFSTDGKFTDTLLLNTLTNVVYYKVAAVDLNYNNSKLCDAIKLLKPDTIAPVPAIIFDYFQDTTGVLIKWRNSTSDDVFQHILLRHQNEKTDSVFSWNNSIEQLKDSAVTPGQDYIYQILICDLSGNITFSEEVLVRYETGFRNGATNFNGTLNRDKKQIQLTWSLPTEEIYAIQIYRAKNDGSFILYKTIRDNTAQEYIDTNLAPNNVYRYKIRIVYQSGASSKLSSELELNY